MKGMVLKKKPFKDCINLQLLKGACMHAQEAFFNVGCFTAVLRGQSFMHHGVLSLHVYLGK